MLSLNDISDVKAITFFSREQRLVHVHCSTEREIRAKSLCQFTAWRETVFPVKVIEKALKSRRNNHFAIWWCEERELQSGRQSFKREERLLLLLLACSEANETIFRSQLCSFVPSIPPSPPYSHPPAEPHHPRVNEIGRRFSRHSLESRTLIRTTVESTVYYRIKIRSVPTARGVLRNTEILHRVKANNAAILFPFPFHHLWDFATKKGKKREQIVSNEMEVVRTSKIRLPLQYEWFQSHWSS